MSASWGVVALLCVAQTAHAGDDKKKSQSAPAPKHSAPAARPAPTPGAPAGARPTTGGFATRPGSSVGSGAGAFSTRPATSAPGGFATRPGAPGGGGFATRPAGPASGSGFATRPGGATGASSPAGVQRFPSAPAGDARFGGARGFSAARPGGGGGAQDGVAARGGAGRGFGERAVGGRVAVMNHGLPMRSDARRFSYHGRSFSAFRAARYRYPSGFHYRRFRSGEYLPAALLATEYEIAAFDAYGLAPPGAGLAWVRVGPDALLVNTETNEIADSVPGVFDESAPDDGGGDPAAFAAEPPPPAYPPVDPSLPPAFALGAFQLGHGASGGCVRFYGNTQVRADLDAAWQAQDWNGVARAVIAQGCETDLSFYLLGLSAEGLGLNQAAAVYYSGAQQMSTRTSPNPYRSCRPWPEDACRGVSIPDESAAGLQRVSGPGAGPR